jgi:hypothetical protein
MSVFLYGLSVAALLLTGSAPTPEERHRLERGAPAGDPESIRSRQSRRRPKADRGRAAALDPVQAFCEARFSMRFHSASETGMTERREMRTSGKSLKAASALISASVTARGSFLPGATSTA